MTTLTAPPARAAKIAHLVGAERLDWDLITAQPGATDHEGDPVTPGVYITGTDPDDEPENGPAVILTVEAHIGRDGVHAGDDEAQRVARQLVHLLAGE